MSAEPPTPQAQTIQIRLNAEGVSEPVKTAARVSSGILRTAFHTFEGADFERIDAHETGGVSHRILGPPQTQEERVRDYIRWILTKALQDLAKGLRETLEEAAVFIELAKIGGQAMTEADVHEYARKAKHRANGKPFPKLLEQVKDGLLSPPAFELDMGSLQRVRNCLEHRNGRVGQLDLDEGAEHLALRYPKLKVFTINNGVEIELTMGGVIQGDADPDGMVQVYSRFATKELVFPLGGRIKLSPKEFEEIAFACWQFGLDIAGRLPPPA